MKIALPVAAKNLEAGINSSYGRAPYYYIYSSQEKRGIFLDNPAAGGAGGVGVKAAQILVDAGAKKLITPRLGDNAAKVLIEAGIKLFLAQGRDIMENIESLEAGELDRLSEIHSGRHEG